MNAALKEKLKKLPDKPGIYMHKNEEGKVIYVGKAKNLKNRVRSYFQANVSGEKTKSLVKHIHDTDWFVVDNETEAFLLERDLIREYRPHYNILLKDDKSYPYIKLTTGEAYPRVILTRRHVPDGGKYYGPFTSADSARRVVEAINLYIPLRMCSKTLFSGRKVGKVCLNYHMGHCIGPCTGLVSEQDYAGYVDEAAGVLSGKYQELAEKIKTDMLRESEKMNFEAAAHLRDLMASFSDIFEHHQKISVSSTDDRDIMAAASSENLSCVVVLKVRGGDITDTVTRYMSKSGEDKDSEVLLSFIQQYYTSADDIPQEIVLCTQMEGQDGLGGLEETLSDLRGAKTRILLPKKGDKKKLADMAYRNASMNIQTRMTAEAVRKEKAEKCEEELRGLLGVKDRIERIEAVDISNINGADNVGVTVVYLNGKKSPKDYRRYRILTAGGVGEGNDYASMGEVVRRRLSRAKEELKTGEENPKFLPLPQVIFADGGLNHVKVIQDIIDEFGYDITAAGLVKDAHHKLRGVMTLSSGETRTSSLRYSSGLLNDISDEVHRFAIEYHRASRSRNMIKSELTDIEGIGPKRAGELIAYFGSLEKIMEASEEELARCPGMNSAAAKNVKNYFNERTINR